MLVSAQTDFSASSYQTIGSSTNVQFYQPGIISGPGWTSPSIYWPEFDREVCRERQDFIVQVLPGGCQPAVVRSDLLEEQNVPVFCKIMLIQTNPLIDVSRVKTISFPGTRPKGVAGITYFPPTYYNYAQRKNVDMPVDDNIGYFVVSLQRTPNEDDMPEWIEGNLTAVIDYDIENALGIGRTNFYVSEIPEDEWLRDYKFYSFWNGKAYIKPESIESDRVTVSVYRDFDTKEATVTLKKGEYSSPIYLGGFYCAAGLVIKAEDIRVPEETALLQIGEEQTWVAKGDRILDEKCRVEDVNAEAEGGKVRISCNVQNGTFDLRLYGGKAKMTVNGDEGEYSIGANIKDNIYLAYTGLWKEGEDKKKFAVLVSDPGVQTELAFQERNLYSVIDKVVSDKNNQKLALDALMLKIQQAIASEYNKQLKITTFNKDYVLVVSGEGKINALKLENGVLTKGQEYTIRLSQDGTIENKEWKEDDAAYIYYKKAIQSYTDLADFYPTEKKLEDDYYEPYAAEGLYRAAKLAQDFEMYEDREEFYSRLRRDYPDSDWLKTADNDLQRFLKYDTKDSRAVVNLRDGSYFVQVLDFKKPTTDELGVDLMINGVEQKLGKDEIFYVNKAGVSTTSGFIEGKPKPTTTLKQLFDFNLPAKTAITVNSNVKVLTTTKLEGDKYNFYSSTTQFISDVGTEILESLKVTYIKIPVTDINVNTYDSLFETIKRTASSSSATSETIQVTDIDTDKVTLLYNKPAAGQTNSITKTETLEKGRKEQVAFEENTVRLLNINAEKQAKLVLDSEVRGPRAYTNFSFKIGIEKRGIKLSTEKTKEMIANIEESIKKWEDINEKLGKVVKGLKSACFATSAVLTAKNLLTGFSGEAMARNEIMTIPGGWNDKCEQLASQGYYYNIQACLLDKNDEIESDIQIYAKAIQATNEKLEQARQGLVESTNILDFEGQVTNRAAMENTFKELIDCQNLNIEGYNGDECKDLSFGDLKEIYTLNAATAAGGSGVLQNSLKNQSSRLEEEAKLRYNTEVARQKASQEVNQLGMKMTYLDGDKITNAYIEGVDAGDKFYNKGTMTIGESLIAITAPLSFSGKNYDIGDLGGKTVFIEVKDPEGDGAYTVTSDSRFYKSDGTLIPSENNIQYAAIQEHLKKNGAKNFRQADTKAYENKILNPDKLMVKYFERAPYKGLPAEVPFDVDNGWYVEMEYVLSGFGKPYDESGRVVNFYVCNVGGNGLIEFKRQADDICRYYNGVSDDLGFPGLSSSESRALVARARNAVAEAMRYYGKEEAYINNRKFKTGISFGGEAGRCTDFMSARDCNLMFNVCDPVICPASRCDLGGTFPVDNVIQTGIIGSLVLCLPNIKENIYIPICLSGVHAGIEGYLSILKAHRDCLNESLATGRTIGICDEIRSIYLCEFFWRQMVPFFDVIVPKLIESFMGQGTRGGGEYLTVQSAWDNTQKSIDYFTDEYAVNSMKAFQMRSTEEAGSEICKSFISARYPTDLDLLTEPDSPPQYHAWFDENVMTTATPYPTSHYKVYYHIYSGNDQGVYYTVYLKDIPEEFTTSYIYRSDYYVVDRGYIPAGDSVDNAKDFTAPSGYKQLCLNINGQDECGFGKVSTSFAVDYIADLYAKEQAEQQITTSKECVAGTQSLLSMAQPNLQAGAEEVVEPELYNQGIVRVCATYNPGRQVNSKGEYDTTNSTFDRWKDVGYCDDPTLRCWLDTESVKDVIKNKELEQQVLSEVDTSVIGSGDYLTPEKSREIAGNGEELIAKAVANIQQKATEEQVQTAIKDAEKQFQDLSALSPSNSFRARGLILLGKLYGDAANKIKGKIEETKTGTTMAETGVKKQSPYGEFTRAIEPTESEPQETEKTEEKTTITEWTDSMLKEAVLLTLNRRTLASDITYYYHKGKWTSVDSDVANLGYVNGIRKIVSKINVIGGYIEVGTNRIEKDSRDNDETMATKVFEALKLDGATQEEVEIGTIKLKGGFFTPGQTDVNVKTFKRIEIDLVDYKFVKSLKGELYYEIDKYDADLDRQWIKATGEKTGIWEYFTGNINEVYNKGETFYSSPVRITESGITGSNPAVDTLTFKKFSFNDKNYRCVKSDSKNTYYCSTDFGVTWKTASGDVLTKYMNINSD